MAIVPFIVVLTICAVFLGRYLARVFQGQHTFLTPLAGGVERWLLRIFGVQQDEEQTWKQYAVSLLLFNALGLCFLFILQLVQQWLPGNPQHLGAVRLDTAFNAAVSFMTNTNWQSYSGETTMSYLTQMLGMTVQNFLSAATGIAAAIAVIRGFVRRSTNSIGCFWVDLTRALVYVLLPMALVLSLILVSQGTIQTLRPTLSVTTLEGQVQRIAVGPAASQVAIKHVGTNGGGFFNANAAHPFESPSPFTDSLLLLSFLLIPAALPFTFGEMLGDRKQGTALFLAMLVMFSIGLGISLHYELAGNPALARVGVAGGVNMEGKEQRFGPIMSTLFAQSTTVTSTGAVDSMHDSFTPIPGLVMVFNMTIGEVIFGGVGVGLVGMLLYVILTLFIVGLMIGRTPEYLGKKLEPREMLMAVVGLLGPPIAMLLTAGLAFSVPSAVASVGNAGSHGMTEIIYACASAAGNNGSAFAGLNANTPFYNVALALLMLVGRFATILPALAVAGSVAAKKRVQSGVTFSTTSILFVFMLIFVVTIVGGLTYFSPLVLGPLLEFLKLR
jgi:K+-transporting ATPase ATPase A chain